ncbi:MAG: CPBP family intramembrane metalloprotease [Candidatus Marinimicrobia bacterium]|nr:CPBP family intramembrane metalloprotease [Candidatus Neomarinimicrobiota bacterium]
MSEVTVEVEMQDGAKCIPLLGIVASLVGFPLLYMANSLAPWSRAFFGNLDRTYYFVFFASVLTLHWLNAGLAIFLTRKAGLTLEDLGLYLSWGRALRVLRNLIILGAVFVLLRQVVPYSLERPDALAIFPRSVYEQLFFIPVALSAGFCEEIVYRGFGITALAARGLRVWQAVVLTTLSFTFMHGPAGIFAFPIFFGGGLLYAGIYFGRVGGISWGRFIRPSGTKSLLRAMVIHGIGDMTAILVP